MLLVSLACDVCVLLLVQIPVGLVVNKLFLALVLCVSQLIVLLLGGMLYVVWGCCCYDVASFEGGSTNVVPL